MRRRSFAVVVGLVAAGVVAAGADKPEVFTGKVVPLPAAKGEAEVKARGLELKADDGTSYPLVEDDASAMLFLDERLRNRPVRLTAVRADGGKKLQVVLVQTVRGGQVYDVDYWCEICQISGNRLGPCVCCGDDVELRERPAR